MTAADPARTAPAPAARPSDGSARGELTALSRLLRLNLRLDRVRIAVWTGAFLLMFWGTVVALQDAFPDQASLQARAQFSDNAATRVIVGPGFGLDNYTFGAMVANELSMLSLVAIAIMGITLTIRHTRGEEESGRMETIRSLPVGRHAPAVAALLSVTVALIIVGTGVALALIVTGLEVASSVAFGVALALTGAVFAGIALIAAQVTEFARSATGLAMAALGAAFLLRAVGDAARAEGSWPSWLSPLAWAQQTRLYVELRWWPLALTVALTGGALVVAVLLGRRRDLGAGLRRPRPGPRAATGVLTTPIGFANRLLRGSALAWVAGVLLFGLTMGSVVDALVDMYNEIPGFDGIIALDPRRINDSFAAALLSTLMAGPVAQVVTSVLRWREEESSGRVSGLLMAGVSRARLFAGWLGVAAAYATVSVAALGLGIGVGMATALGDASWVLAVLSASLAYLPAVLAVAAVAAALIGLAPGRAGLVWIVVLWVVLISWLGELLGIPQWLRDLSPVELTPGLPLDALTWDVPVAMTGMTVLLATAAIVGLRRRDLLA